MNGFARFVQSRPVNIVSGLLLAALWCLFAYRHFQAYGHTGHLIFLVFFFSETLQAGFFAFRSVPKTVSTSPFDWMVAAGGTFTPLFFRPEGPVLWQGAETMVILGMMLQMFGLLSLNRSFAIVAAKREIKTLGMYTYVRHPMYASYILIYSGYVIFNASPINLFLWFLASAFLFLRIESEEAHLSKDPEYRAYRDQVRYRLIPFVY
jgi:protein-S-isoprenylcysteine O-methyltransferase Ste14